VKRKTHSWQCRAAWVFIIISIVFWLWFGIGSAYVEGGGWVNWLMHLLIPGGIFVLSALVAWWRERIGGLLFLVEGVIATGFLTVAAIGGRSEASTLLLMLLTLALPPLISGILMLVCWGRSRQYKRVI
jgi:hypothetical protein